MRKRWVALFAVVGGVWWAGGDEPVRPRHDVQPQAAVLANGFAVLAGKQVTRHDRAGQVRGRTTLRLDRDEVRFFGAAVGPAVAWREGRQLALAAIAADGELGRPDRVGRDVRSLCESVASNEHRFGVGWKEADGRTWVVFGDVKPSATTSLAEPYAVTAADGASWCGVASAEQKLALLWRERGRLIMNFCDRRSCSGLVVRVPLAERERLLGVGCLRASCLFAAREPGGAVRLLRVDERRRALARPLEQAAADTAVTVVGAGDRAFAVAYVARSGRVAIDRVTVDGVVTRVTELAGRRAPSLVWADGRLLAASPGGEVTVVPLPR